MAWVLVGVLIKRLIVIKNTNGYIFGCSTLDQMFKTDRTAFLFTLTNPSDTPMKSKITEPEEAELHR